MTKINLDELIADREAGTGGPWSDDRKEHEQPYEPIKIKNGFRPICSVYMDDAPVPDFNSAQIANARRIARLPDLEAAYIEAIGFLKRIGESPRDGFVWSDLFAFLERNT